MVVPARILGVPLHYPLLAGVLLLLAPTILRTPVFPFSRSLRSAGLWRWSVAAVVAVGLSFGVGLLRQSVELFADWRNLAVLALVAAAAARWLANQPWRRWVITDMAIAYGVMSSLSLGIWMLGGGSVLLGVRIPIWYFNNLFLAAFAAIVATDFWLEQKEGTREVGLQPGAGLVGNQLDLGCRTQLSAIPLAVIGGRHESCRMEGAQGTPSQPAEDG